DRPDAPHRRSDLHRAAPDRLDRRRAHLARGPRHPDAGAGRRLAHGLARNDALITAGKAKAPRCRHRGAFLSAYDVDYFDIDFSNMRLSFSLFASQHCCAACAADAAWLAVFCAEVAACCAAAAARLAPSAAVFTLSRSPESLETCDLSESTSACKGFRS